MKRIVFPIGIVLMALGVMAQNTGYKIHVQIKPLKKTWVYMGYYYGKMMPIGDSAFLDEQGRGVFQGAKPLAQGIYLLAISKSKLLMEMLVGKKQQFTVITDTANPETLTKFVGSPENDQFKEYTVFVSAKGQAAEEAKKKLAAATDPAEKAKQQALIDKNVKDMEGYRKKVMKEQPTSLLSAIFGSMQDLSLPENLKKPKSYQDTLATYYYSRQHFWDGVDFMDGRLVRTPVFEKKLNYYLNAYVQPDADSIIHEFNWMMALGRNDTEMFQYLIGYFVDNYFNPKIMGQDKVFVHIYEKYFATKQVTWLTEKQLKQIEDRAMMLISNQVGEASADLSLVDTSGKVQTLYSQDGDYTVVVFWDPNCGHCKTEIPRIDSMYKADWKEKGVNIYAVMSAETSLADWKPFIDKHAVGWMHVHQTVEMRADEEKNKLPNYHQLYDVRTTPTIFLLDKQKHIIAKNLALEDLNKILLHKINQNQARN
ncbi:MAG: redoxin domain-containing protein [Chitinophagaceae bacterium]